jgi:hypothetical protein
MNKLAKEEGENLIKEIKQGRKDRSPIRQNIRKFWLFIKKLAGVLFGLSILGLGVYAAYLGQAETASSIKHLALVVSGACAVVDGVYVLYKALEEKK